MQTQVNKPVPRKAKNRDTAAQDQNVSKGKKGGGYITESLEAKKI